MRRLCILLLGLLPIATGAKEKVPAWVQSKPAVDGYYTGVGSAPMASKDAEAKAKEIALADLLSDIEVLIENQSLMERLDSNGEYSENYKNDIRSQSKAWLEGYELADTYNDGSRVWVYYKLNRNEYERLRKQRTAEAVNTALDLWIKGKTALKSGRFADAAELYAKGINTIEPFSNQKLTVESDGVDVNIGTELLTSLTGMFSQLRTTVTPSSAHVRPFISDPYTLTVRIESGDNPVSGVRLNAKFDTGTAKINVLSSTDRKGYAKIEVSDLSAKPATRHLTITPTIDLDGIFNSPALEKLSDRLKKAITPITATIIVENPELKAICRTGNSSDQLVRQITTYLNNSYFDMVSDETEADLALDIETSFKAGNVVTGDMYNMREYFTSATVTVTDLKKNTVVATASISDLRSLSPEKTNMSKARGDAYRNMFKKLQKQLDQQLAAARFERRATDSQHSTNEHSLFFDN